MRVIHVHLIFKKQDHFFGSISAIFDYLSEDDIGMAKSTLIHSLSSDTICTGRAIIKRREILRCKHEVELHAVNNLGFHPLSFVRICRVFRGER